MLKRNNTHYRPFRKWTLVLLCGLVSFAGYAQKRTVKFTLDLRNDSYHVNPGAIHVHVRETVDRERYTDATGKLDEAGFAAAIAGKIDTNVTLGPEYDFSLRNLTTGASYSVSLYYWVPLNDLPNRNLARFRASYQTLKINTWSYQCTLVAPICFRDRTLNSSICPKCRRSDKSIPMAYEPTALEVDDPLKPPFSGKTLEAGEPDSGCSANWYCERDRIRF